MSEIAFKNRGNAAVGEFTATEYLDSFINQYQSQIPFDLGVRKAYFFDQETILANGGTNGSVMIGSFEANQSFYELSNLGSVPEGGELREIQVGERLIEAIVFPETVFRDTSIGGMANEFRTRQDIEDRFGLSCSNIHRFAQIGNGVKFNVSTTYCLHPCVLKDSRITEFLDICGHVDNVNFDAFYGSQQLTSITFTQAQTFGRNAFRNCTKLATVHIPQATQLDRKAFFGCISLRTLCINNVITLCDSVFEGCELLASIDLNSLNTLHDSVFSGCTELTELVLPNLEGVTVDSFKGWGGIGYTLTVPTAMASNEGVVKVQGFGTTIVLI